MAKKKNGVSGKTHTQAQLDNYAKTRKLRMLTILITVVLVRFTGIKA